MSRRKRAAIWAAAFSVICGLIIWHVIQWHSTGIYLVMYSWIGTGKAYITVLYDLALMVVLGVVLGLLMEKITDLLGYEVEDTRRFDRGAEVGKRQ
ncbi:hypothetical protein ACFLU9_02225 [Chloroflexota bacterium]